MTFLLVSLWSVVCTVVGERFLRKGIAYQLQGIPRGIRLQILAVIITFGLPILVAFTVK